MPIGYISLIRPILNQTNKISSKFITKNIIGISIKPPRQKEIKNN